MRRIRTDSDVEAGLEALVKADRRLSRVRDLAGPVPLRLAAPGLPALVSIVISQQVSRASADAILARLNALLGVPTAQALSTADDDLFRSAGLSRPKVATLRALGEAVGGGLDLDALCDIDAAEAVARLTSVRGVGPWTAEVYLLFAAGHPDIFPTRDVALQSAVGHAFDLTPRPDADALRAIAESWAPWRGVAARLFWAYYGRMRGREGAAAVSAPINPPKN